MLSVFHLFAELQLLYILFLFLFQNLNTLVCLFFEFFLLFGKVRDNFHLRDHFFDAFLQLVTVWSLEGRFQETRLIQLKNMLWISNLFMDARCDPFQISAKV